MTPNVAEGIALLRSAATKKPDDFTIRQRLLEACARAGQFDDVVREFADLVRAFPLYPQVHFEALGRAATVSSPQSFCTAFEQAALATPNDHVAWYGLGLSRQLVHDQVGATEAFKAGLRANQHAVLLQYNLGVALLGQPFQAVMWLEGVTRFSPQMAEPYYALGSIYMDQDASRAITLFHDFIRLAPPHLEAYVRQAKLHLQLLQDR